MRKYCFLFTILLSFFQLNSQTFNWVQQEIAPDQNLKGMTVSDAGVASIVGYGRTFKTSFDDGINWQDVDIFSDDFNFVDLSIKGQTGFLVANKHNVLDNPSGGEDDIYVNGVLLKTIDGGFSWTLLNLDGFGEGEETSLNPTLPGCMKIDFQSIKCVNDTLVYAGIRWDDVSNGDIVAHSAVFRSKDGGLTWKAITTDLEGAVVTSFCILNDTLFAGGNQVFFKVPLIEGEIIDLYPTLDEGSDDKMYISDLDAVNSTELIVITTSDSIFSSKNMGQSFQQIGGVKGAFDFFKYNDDVMISLGSSTQSKATIDGGKNWTSVVVGSSIWEIGGVFNDSLVALAKGDIYKLAVSDLLAGNYIWHSQTVHPTYNLHKFHIINENTALVAGYGRGLKITDNGGVTWNDVELPSHLLTTEAMSVPFNSISMGDDGIYVSSRRLRFADYPSSSGKNDAYYSGMVLKSNDDWQTFKILDNTNFGKSKPNDASVNPTMDGCYGLDVFTIECVNFEKAFAYVNWYDTTGIEKITHSRIFRTKDGGDSWDPVSDDLGSSFVNSIAFTGDTGYIAGNNVLLKTIDGGDSFIDLFPLMSQGTDGTIAIQNIQMISAKKLFFVSSVDGVFATMDGGMSFSKLDNCAGGNDIHVFNANSLMVVGTSSKTKFTNDYGVEWDNCSPGASLFKVGEVVNDSLYTLGKGSIYKIALSDLDISKIKRAEIDESGLVKVFNTRESIEVSSNSIAMDQIVMFDLAGRVVMNVTPRRLNHSIVKAEFKPGIYILSVRIEGKTDNRKVILK